MGAQVCSFSQNIYIIKTTFASYAQNRCSLSIVLSQQNAREFETFTKHSCSIDMISDLVQKHRLCRIGLVGDKSGLSEPCRTGPGQSRLIPLVRHLTRSSTAWKNLYRAPSWQGSSMIYIRKTNGGSFRRGSRMEKEKLTGSTCLHACKHASWPGAARSTSSEQLVRGAAASSVYRE